VRLRYRIVGVSGLILSNFHANALKTLNQGFTPSEKPLWECLEVSVRSRVELGL